MTVVMQAAPNVTGNLPGGSTPFASSANGAAPSDGSPFASMLLALANTQAAAPATSQAPGTSATPFAAPPPGADEPTAAATSVVTMPTAPAAPVAPNTPIIVSLEPTAAVAGPSDAPAGPVEVMLLDPLDAESEPLDPAALSAQAALLANQLATPKLPQESSPLLDAAVSEEVVALSANAESQAVVVSPDALMPALPGVGDDDELRTNRPSVLTPLSAAAAESNGAGTLEPALNASLGDVVAQPLTGPASPKNTDSTERGREMQAAGTDTPGVVRFDGNASSQTSTAQPAVTLPLPPAETDPGAAQVSILSSFATNTAAATGQVAAPVIANAPDNTLDDNSSDSITSEELSTTANADSAAVTPPGPQAASSVDIAANGDASTIGSITAMGAPAATNAAMSEPADEPASDGPSEIRPPSATASNPAAPAAVAAPIAPGTPAGIDASDGAAAPQASPPTTEPAVPHPSVSRVAQTVLEAIESGGGEARIHLQPRELGDVVIHVRTVGDRVEVMVQAERSEAVNVIRENAQDLTGLLGQSGLNLTDLNVSLGMQQQGRGGWGEGSNQPNNRLRGDSEFAAVLGTDPTVATTNHNRLRATYNPDGAHLYRV